ncbi:hypothetical protein MLV97_09950, partial [Escherichia coli]|nr:hypothetical protein [Escherichia coli]
TLKCVPTQYVVLIDYNCYYSSPRKRCDVVDKRMAIAESTGKRNEKTGKRLSQFLWITCS